MAARAVARQDASMRSVSYFTEPVFAAAYRGAYCVGTASMDNIKSAFIVTAMTNCLVLIRAAIMTAFF
jgi:hypothetical protein